MAKSTPNVIFVSHFDFAKSAYLDNSSLTSEAGWKEIRRSSVRNLVFTEHIFIYVSAILLIVFTKKK